MNSVQFRWVQERLHGGHETKTKRSIPPFGVWSCVVRELRPCLYLIFLSARHQLGYAAKVSPDPERVAMLTRRQ